jgi:membrane protein required for colicin V production
MTWLDYAFLGVLVISIAWGIWRGFAREAVSLSGWVLAFVVAKLLSEPLGEKLPESFGQPEVRVVIAFVAVLILMLAVTTLIGLALWKALKAVGLGGLDRTLGGVFGFARGLLIMLAFALLAGLTSMPRQPFWTHAVSRNLLEQSVLFLKPWLPPAFAQRLRYH